jgi:hypothetical protein
MPRTTDDSGIVGHIIPLLFRRAELDFIINYDIKYRMGREGLMNEN